MYKVRVYYPGYPRREVDETLCEHPGWCAQGYYSVDNERELVFDAEIPEDILYLIKNTPKDGRIAVEFETTHDDLP